MSASAQTSALPVELPTGDLRFGIMETMPFKRSRTCVEPEPETDEEVAPEVPTSFATKGVGWSGREKDDLEVIDLNETER